MKYGVQTNALFVDNSNLFSSGCIYTHLQSRRFRWFNSFHSYPTRFIAKQAKPLFKYLMQTAAQYIYLPGGMFTYNVRKWWESSCSAIPWTYLEMQRIECYAQPLMHMGLRAAVVWCTHRSSSGTHWAAYPPFFPTSHCLEYTPYNRNASLYRWYVPLGTIYMPITVPHKLSLYCIQYTHIINSCVASFSNLASFCKNCRQRWSPFYCISLPMHHKKFL